MSAEERYLWEYAWVKVSYEVFEEQDGSAEFFAFATVKIPHVENENLAIEISLMSEEKASGSFEEARSDLFAQLPVKIKEIRRLTERYNVPEEDCPACALGAFCKAMDYPGGDYTWDELDKLMRTLDEYPSFRGKGFSTPGKIADFSDLSPKKDVIDMLHYLAEWFGEIPVEKPNERESRGVEVGLRDE